jgi:hypothetical protein
MNITTKSLPKSLEEAHKIILLQQQEITSHKERYVRLLEEFKLEKSRRFGTSSEKNMLQSDIFDEPGIEPEGELKDQLDDTITIESYQRKQHPTR